LFTSSLCLAAAHASVNSGLTQVSPSGVFNPQETSNDADNSEIAPALVAAGMAGASATIETLKDPKV